MKNRLFLMALVLLCAACSTHQNKRKMENNAYSFYIGTYTDGDSKGIYQMTMDEHGKFGNLKLQAETMNPSFLCFANNEKTLIAVNEINSLQGNGSVESYKIDSSLTLISRKSSGGAHPCFVTANDQGIVLTANYSSGNTGLLKVNSLGELSELLDVDQHQGKGTVTGRQDAPHAHSIWFFGDRQRVISADLGTNELWFSHIDSLRFVPAENRKFSLPEGSGPRHLAFHPNGKTIYVINELSNTISQLENIGSDFRFVADYSTLPKDFVGNSFTADLHISKDGKFLYASNRGHNSIAIFAVDKMGKLDLLAHESVRGDHPRNFSLSPDEKFLVVANQNTNNIISFQRNKESGMLTFVDEAKAPKPVCILFRSK